MKYCLTHHLTIEGMRLKKIAVIVTVSMRNVISRSYKKPFEKIRTGSSSITFRPPCRTEIRSENSAILLELASVLSVVRPVWRPWFSLTAIHSLIIAFLPSQCWRCNFTSPIHCDDIFIAISNRG